MSIPTIVNFTANDKGTATLTRAMPRVDANTEGTHQWDIDLVAGVDEAGADHVAPALPQVGEYLARARDGQGSAQITIKPTSRDLRLTLHTSDGTEVAKDVAAEIRHLRMHLTEKAQNYVARLRLHGLEPAVGAALVSSLGKPLQVTAEPTQQALDFDGVPLGSLVTARTENGTDVFGLLLKRTTAGLVVDNFGVLYTVSRVNAAITLADGWPPFAEGYEDNANRAGTTPDWRDLVTALAAVGDGTTLDQAVVDNALGIPPEAVNG